MVATTPARNQKEMMYHNIVSVHGATLSARVHRALELFYGSGFYADSPLLSQEGQMRGGRC